MTPTEIIAEARNLINDTKAPYRQEDTELLAYVNDALRECAVLRPDIFSTIGDYTCMAGQCEQSLDFNDAAALLEVLCIHNGNALLPFDLMAMSAFNPGWRTDTAGPATQWAKFANDPLKFYVYPKAPVAQSIDVRYVRIPATVGLTDPITDLPTVYQSALTDYVVSRAEAKDDEHVNSNRSAQFLQSFVAKMKG